MLQLKLISAKHLSGSLAKRNAINASLAISTHFRSIASRGTEWKAFFSLWKRPSMVWKQVRQLQQWWARRPSRAAPKQARLTATRTEWALAWQKYAFSCWACLCATYPNIKNAKLSTIRRIYFHKILSHLSNVPLKKVQGDLACTFSNSFFIIINAVFSANLSSWRRS